MSLIGSIESLNPKESDNSSYIERFEQLFECKDVVSDVKMVSLLILTLMGGETYGVLKDLLSP